MDTVMLQFKHEGAPPSIDDVRRLFNLAGDEIDETFGVVPIDPAENLYAVLVSNNVRDRVEAVLNTRSRTAAEGVFANPRIEPFGPPER
jgi:hypothetical protein